MKCIEYIAFPKPDHKRTVVIQDSVSGIIPQLKAQVRVKSQNYEVQGVVHDFDRDVVIVYIELMG